MSGYKDPPTQYQFTSQRQPKNNGRKPSHLRKFIKDDNIGTQDVRLLIGGILSKAKTVEDWKALLTDPKTPPFVLVFLKALIKDYSNSKTDTARFLLQYGFGMPKQEIETKQADSEPVNMTPEERKEAERELIKQIIAENKELIKEVMKDDVNEQNN